MTHRFASRLTLAFALFLLASITASPSSARAETVTIAAANSLRDALRGLLPQFEAQHPNLEVRVIYGPSQTLRKQIEEGAPVDLYLPSLLDEIELLEQKGLVINGTKRIYGKTSLVLITQTGFPSAITSLADLQTNPSQRMAVGNPKTSAVGKVAAQFLKSSGIEPKIKSHLLFGDHSRAVLDLVLTGEADLGLVYRTDIASESKVRILANIPDGSHAPIQYGVAMVWSAQNPAAAENLIEFLASPPIQVQLAQHGFEPVNSATRVVQAPRASR